MSKFLKSNLKIIIPILGLILFYSSSAQTKNLTCQIKIPLGESADQTSDLLNSAYKELEVIHQTIPEQIEAAQEIIESAQKCNLDNCKPVCVDLSCYGPKIHSDCPGSFTCNISPNGESKCDCNDELYGGSCSCAPFCKVKCAEESCKGKICPDLGIPTQSVVESFEKINNSFKQIKVIFGQDEGTIQENLDKARTDFTNCAKISESKAISCKNILSQNNQFSTEQIERCKSVCEKNKKTAELSSECLKCLCGSPTNYFCCY